MVVGKGFASLQSAVSLLAGLASLSGALYSAVQFAKPAPRTGDILAIVRGSKSDKAPPGTTVEILTPQDALVATLKPGDDGSARGVLEEGPYRMRATAPRFEAQTRDVQVQRGATAEVRLQLVQQDADEGPSRARRSGDRARPISRAVGGAQRFLHRLGL
ncbi:MAG: carboxypeptidase regulatory-like domain-containing protein [Deltaproteobacteria bacterium]|nr:MAG: carboxypeptidase regulatory-like domain-containing protein [Deltaproteobacteria bacterium]TMA67490.1 MAG: carboxypeptidase regulatory-like domain-containing protein [Deltaproteobacteria bacterium]TMB41978.1 MAG: carboxypeptidase regulatory-like domain-containing protein [Deltaproteobacteria bacterium]